MDEQTGQPQGPHPRAGRDLTTGSIPRHLIAFSTPMLAGSALQTGYSMVNAFWVGKFLGTGALAAVTIIMPIVFLLMAVAMGLTMAGNILVSQAYGAKDFPRMRKVVQNASVLTAGVTVLALVVGESFAGTILRVMDTPAEVFPMAYSYLRIFLLFVPATFGVFLIGALLRGIGDSKTPLYFQAASVTATAILDPILMFGWLGAPRLGLNGTAYASIITSTAGVIALAVYLRRRQSPIMPRLRSLGFDGATSRLIIKIGIPSMVQQSLVATGMMVVVGIVNGFGEQTAAAYGAASRIDQIAFMPALTIGMAIATLSGQNIGAAQFGRVREVFWWGLALGCGITLVCSVAVVSLPHVLLRMFTSDPQVLAIGAGYLRIVGLAYVFFAVMFVSNGVINGAGHTLMTTSFTLVSLWVVRVPLAEVLARLMHRPEGIWFALVISYAVGMSISLIYFSTGRWKRPVGVRETVSAA